MLDMYRYLSMDRHVYDDAMPNGLGSGGVTFLLSIRSFKEWVMHPPDFSSMVSQPLIL